MTAKKKLFQPKTVEMIIRAVDGLLSIAALVFSLRLLMIDDAETPVPLYALLAYCFFAASKCIQALKAFKTNRSTFILNLCCAAVLIAAGLVVYYDSFSILSIRIYIAAFCLTIVAGRIRSLINNRKRRSLIWNLLVTAVFAYYIYCVISMPADNIVVLLSAHVIVAFIAILAHIISISFSQMRLGVLRKIVRKTFAAEIMFGLALLMIAFSFVFQTLEPAIKTYADALWYCFAVVTTIGFGDISAVTGIGRLLTVILGIYGIVVVALITSIIVNFYTEVKDEKDDGDNPEEIPDEVESKTEKVASQAEKQA